MPDIQDVAATLDGTGGLVLDGLVEVMTVGKWSHRRYSDGRWSTTVAGADGLVPGTYRLRLRFGRWTADMRQAAFDGERFTGTSVVAVTEEARA